MADSPPYRDTSDDTDVGPDRGSTTGTPRWVKVFGVIALVLVLVFVVLKVTGLGGEHGPGRHTDGGDTSLASVTEGHTPSGGVVATHRLAA